MTAPSLRVLMTADAVGGVWTHVLSLSAILTRWDIEVCLATLGPSPSPEQYVAAGQVPNVALVPIGGSLEWMPDPWSDMKRTERRLLGLAERWRPDIVHLNGYSQGALPWRVPTIVVAHSCVLSWWQAVHGRAAPSGDWQHYRAAVRRGIEAAAMVVAPSRTMLESVIAHYGRPRNAQVIPNGILSQRSRCPSKAAFVFSAGRLWDAAKNITAVDRAAQRLSWPVYVAGERSHPAGGEIDLLHARAVGRLSATEIAEWYKRASIFVLPARYEPFGLSSLEAARAGCALVLGDIQSQREIWKDAAMFVPTEDTKGLRAVIQGLIDDPYRLSVMAYRARRRAASFTAYRMARSYRAVYAHLIADRGGHKSRVAA